MHSVDPVVTRYDGDQPPTESDLHNQFSAEGLQPYQWSNGPGDKYSPHSHDYHKVIYVLSGSITFGLPDRGGRVHLEAGDRLDLPAGVSHDALVGPYGVVCLEAHRSG
jgi:quercetin dioxygenase-like cupin family protein